MWPSSSMLVMGLPTAKGVPVAGERVGGQGHVGEGAVVHVPGQELGEARGVGAEPHVVLAGGGVPAHGVEPVGVERRAGRAGGGVVLSAPVHCEVMGCPRAVYP